jgi:predicted component of type VI protein secretion system
LKVNFDVFDGERLVSSTARELGEVRIGSLDLPGWLHLPFEGVARLHAVIEVVEEGLRFTDFVGRDLTSVNGAPVGVDHRLSSGDEIRLGSKVVITVTFPASREEVKVEYIPPPGSKWGRP